MNSFDEKLRRAQRRRNHIARDLALPKFRQKVVPSKKKTVNWEDDIEE